MLRVAQALGALCALAMWSVASDAAMSTLHSSIVRRRQKAGTAAVFTPYYLTPGGGEKYLLSTVRAMQTLGFYVDILVQSDNVCQVQNCVLALAQSLRVTLDPDMFGIHVVHKEGFKIYAGPYDLFFALGNEKYPPVTAIGRVNFYMCQFPFDLDRIPPQFATETHASYDVVLLNSYYSLRWYHSYSTPMYHDQFALNMLFPRTQVLHPPVTLEQYAVRERSTHKNIVMVGRFFAGRQSKGHPQAIKIFSELYSTLPEETRLIMVGNPVLGHNQYLEDLRNLISSYGLADRIEIVLAAPPERVVSILQSGLVQWHLTGLGVKDDPASLEHFGISIVEGMSLGCIPVAYTGGAADIIQHGHDGYVASSAERVIQYTRNIFAMPPAQQRQMQSRGLAKSRNFDYSKFELRFHDLYHATELLKPTRAFTADRVATLRN